MRVFISGPYSGNPVANTEAAMDAAHALMDLGFHPFCPHLSHFLEQYRSRPYEEWMRLDLEWVAQCDVLLRLPGESEGADREVAAAKSDGIRVFFSIEEVDAYRRGFFAHA